MKKLAVVAALCLVLAAPAWADNTANNLGAASAIGDADIVPDCQSCSSVTPLVGATALQFSTYFGSKNLSNLASAATARTNLGLGTAATQNLSAFLQPSNNLSDILSAVTARANLGLGNSATQSIPSANLLGGTGTAFTGVSVGSGLSLLGGVLSSTSGGGSVTNVALSLPGIFTVTGSPITGAGTLTGTFNTQAANTALRGPVSGSAASPTFRADVVADLPTGIPLANIATIASPSLLGNGSGSTAIPAALTPGVNLCVTASTINVCSPVETTTTSSVTLASTDAGKLVVMNVTGGGTLTISATGFGTTVLVPGQTYYVQNISASATTVTNSSGAANGMIPSITSIPSGGTLILQSDSTAATILAGVSPASFAGASGLTVGTTTITSGTTLGLLYDNGGALGNLATANSGVLVTSSGGTPSISTTLPSGLAMQTPASLVLANATALPAAQVSSGALANGMTGTTQAANSNDTKLATDAYADAKKSTATVGWIATVNPLSAPLIVFPANSTLTSLVGNVETATGGTATVSVNVASSGTACGSGTTVHSSSMNANGTAATNQTLTLTTTAVTAGQRLCLVTTGTTTWTGGTGIGGITVSYTTP